MCAAVVSLFVENESITLTKQGDWLSNGELITHERTVRLFFRSIVLEDGHYYLRVGQKQAQERREITVEDTPAFVSAITGDPSTGFTLRLLGQTESDESLTLEPLRLRYENSRLTYHLPSGLIAKFLTQPYYELLNQVSEQNGKYFLQIIGNFVEISDDSVK